MSSRTSQRPRDIGILNGQLPAAFERREITLDPGAEWLYSEDDRYWRDAMVIVEEGEIELVGLCGTRKHLGTGSMLWFAGMPLRALYNPRREAALLVAVARRSR